MITELPRFIPARELFPGWDGAWHFISPRTAIVTQQITRQRGRNQHDVSFCLHLPVNHEQIVEEAGEQHRQAALDIEGELEGLAYSLLEDAGVGEFMHRPLTPLTLRQLDSTLDAFFEYRQRTGLAMWGEIVQHYYGIWICPRPFREGRDLIADPLPSFLEIDFKQVPRRRPGGMVSRDED